MIEILLVAGLAVVYRPDPPPPVVTIQHVPDVDRQPRRLELYRQCLEETDGAWCHFYINKRDRG